jgi:ubiquinone/menaquinone biosynthesis C-methylase UbiE
MALPERRESSFDILIYFGTLHHIADAERGLAEIQRVPTSSGLFVYETRLARTRPLVAADAAVACRAMFHRRQERWVSGLPVDGADTKALPNHLSTRSEGALA